MILILPENMAFHIDHVDLDGWQIDDAWQSQNKLHISVVWVKRDCRGTPSVPLLPHHWLYEERE
jgi:hypothetical protein